MSVSDWQDFSSVRRRSLSAALTVGGTLALGFGGYLPTWREGDQSPRELEGGKALGMDPGPDSPGLAMTMLMPESEYVWSSDKCHSVICQLKLQSSVYTVVISCLDGKM